MHILITSFDLDLNQTQESAAGCYVIMERFIVSFLGPWLNRVDRGSVGMTANYKSLVCLPGGATVCGRPTKWKYYRIKLKSRPQQADISLFTVGWLLLSFHGPTQRLWYQTTSQILWELEQNRALRLLERGGHLQERPLPDGLLIRLRKN